MKRFSFSLASEVDKINLTEKKSKIPMALRKDSGLQNTGTSLPKEFFFISLQKKSLPGYTNWTLLCQFDRKLGAKHMHVFVGHSALWELSPDIQLH